MAGLVLAAGEGRRFGDSLKQLAPFRGRPLIEYGLAAMEAALPGRRAVVLGYRAELVRRGADLQGAEVVICPDWKSGQAASLRSGLETLTSGAGAVSAVIVTLADQPLISPLAIERLVAARKADRVALRAGYDGRPGHPVLLEKPAIEAAMGISGDRGAGDLLKRLGVSLVDCSGLGSDLDLDTPDRLRQVEGHLKSGAGASMG